MPSLRDLRTQFAKFDPTESFYWFCSDGSCTGTEFVWLPIAQQWIGFDHDVYEIIKAESLYLILSEADGDDSGLNAQPNLLGADFSDNRGLWVVRYPPADLPAGSDLLRVGKEGISND